ncbi:hypothetical protein DASC09_054120 [Saccharomycopsis crataegensis]|uniref:F-box domain-containing protein n=1 Tax=Saccharomycopsis crataegensis TaxID=43959 RepID=A0AAV5QU27_9ASCO|nr:hypothetical protein DASC09_054120 [Saccharomycopsis crataegensis]
MGCKEEELNGGRGVDMANNVISIESLPVEIIEKILEVFEIEFLFELRRHISSLENKIRSVETFIHEIPYLMHLSLGDILDINIRMPSRSLDVTVPEDVSPEKLLSKIDCSMLENLKIEDLNLRGPSFEEEHYGFYDDLSGEEGYENNTSSNSVRKAKPPFVFQRIS